MAEDVIALDPSYPGGHRLLATVYQLAWTYGWAEFSESLINRAVESFEKVLTIDESDMDARAKLGYLYSLKRKYERAISEGQEAVTNSPDSADINAYYSAILLYMGRKEEAIQFAKRALKLNPIPPAWHIQNLGLAYTHAGMYKEATAEFKRAILRNPDYIRNHVGLTICYSILNLLEEARSSASNVLKIDPNFSINLFEKMYPFKSKEDLEQYAGALRKAGLK
jgi:adenylate cyclase